MPAYCFRYVSDGTQVEVELADDQAAWSQLVTFCGEILRDADGNLAPHTEIEVRVVDGTRRIADVRIFARRHTAPQQ